MVAWLSHRLVFAALFGAAPLFVTPTRQRPDKAIHFGIVTSINGDLKPWGEEVLQGAKLAVGEFNAAGGLRGRKVVLDVGDPNSKPSEAGPVTAKLLASHHDLVLIGDVASGLTREIATAAAKKGVPVITPGATGPMITKEHHNLFRVCYTDAFQGPVMAKFAYEELNDRRVAIVTDKVQPYSIGLSNSFRDEFEKLGGKVVSEQFYRTGDVAFQKQLSDIKATSPDAIFISGYFNEAAPIINQAGHMGIHARFLGGDGWDSSQMLVVGGEAVIGTYFCNHFNNLDPRPAVGDFLKKWMVRYSDLPNTTMGALAYDATKLACQALTRAKSIDAHGLRNAIATTVDFAGVTGTITLKDRHGDPPKRAVVVKISRDGQIYVLAYGQDPVTGEPKPLYWRTQASGK